MKTSTNGVGAIGGKRRDPESVYADVTVEDDNESKH